MSRLPSTMTEAERVLQSLGPGWKNQIRAVVTVNGHVTRTRWEDGCELAKSGRLTDEAWELQNRAERRAARKVGGDFFAADGDAHRLVVDSGGKRPRAWVGKYKVETVIETRTIAA